MTPDNVPLLKIEGLSKTFGELKALDGVDLEVLPGEVHGLLGENGSGKSTLIKILSGYYIPDRGAKAWIRGTQTPLPIPAGRYRDLGISFVHQDLALIPELSVVENLRVSQTVAGSAPLINWRRHRALARESFEKYGLDIDPAAPLDSLNNTERTLVAVLRAVGELGDHRSLLVLDEPTVFLPREGTDLLFRVVHELVADGAMSVLLVSHDMTEVLEHTDRVTVLRGGRVQASRDSRASTARELTELIVGRALNEVRTDADAWAAAPVIGRVSHLSTGQVEDLSFDLREGEIVGITGLAGSGYEDVTAGLFGARPATGEITLEGSSWPLDEASPSASLRRKVVYVPADRKVDGGVLDISVEQNITLPVLPQFRALLGLSVPGLKARANQIIEKYDVRPADGELPFGSLSGGNQQKAVLGKWLQDEPQLVLLQEPTQGVDVGARERIFASLKEASRTGISIVCASSDYGQLAALCDRVIVLAKGEAVAEVRGAEITQEGLSNLVINSLAANPDAYQEVTA
jgi:ribose transport system ATP-binding protein